MKGNQGLEALAALCGGQVDAPTETTSRGEDPSRSGGGASAAVVGRGTQLEQQQQQQSTLSNQQQSPLNNVTPQQWQQAIAAAAALQGSAQALNPALAAQSAAQSLLLSAGLAPHPTLGGGGGSENAFMQQLALHQYVQAAKLSAQQAAQLSSGGAPKPSGVTSFDQNQQAVLMALAAGKAQQQLNQARGGTQDLSQHLQQVIPAAASNNNSSTQPQGGNNVNNNATSAAAVALSGTQATANTKTTAAAAMNPPPPPSAPSALPSALSNAGISTQTTHHVPAHANIAPMPGGRILPSATDLAAAQNPVSPTGTASSNAGGGGMMRMDDKKQMKRAANRRSAQLSRKRKKQFIEELKEENDDLRRKELILKSIPDLIVVFDSSGKLGFVSESVSRFIDMTPEELEGTSFWNRLCEDSVRLLKAAFMDSLAARKPDSDTAPLGSGVWELRLIDKDSSYLVVSLNGVVHFSGEAPECVCCIRPRDMQPIQKLPKKQKTTSNVAAAAARAISSSDGSRSSSDNNSGDDELQIRAKPSQSVMGNGDTTSTDVSVAEKPVRLERQPAGRSNNEGDGRIIGTDGQVVRISDADSGCEMSESGSDD